MTAAESNTEEKSVQVIAIVVSYEPDLDFLKKQMRILSTQVKTIVLVDNGSSNISSIKNIADNINCVHLIKNDQNKGLGFAHNEGLRFALGSSADSILILDQDSLPSNSMVNNLVNELKNIRSSGVKVAAVGSRYYGNHEGHSSYFVKFGVTKFRHQYCLDDNTDIVFSADVLISSGTLFSREAVTAVGFMDEDLFIDHVDTEWFLRAKAMGWQSFGICNAVMNHGLGERTIRIWLGRWRYLPVHKPFRYYYVFRNSVLLWRRQYPSSDWKRIDALRLIKIFFVFSVFVKPRLANLAMMYRGVRDGIKGRTGKIE